MESKYQFIENGLANNRPLSNGFNVKRKFANGILTTNFESNKKKKVNNAKESIMLLNQGQGLSGGSSSCIPVANISIEEERINLPVYHVKKSLMKKIMENQSLIIIGETGSGKSTQIPQYILDIKDSNKGMIAITQPRRVAAITISKRVAQECKCKLGETVGYTVRFENVTSNLTKIKFITDGCLLREALSDRLLKNYKVIILDEAHERTINTDVLFGIVKGAQQIRLTNNLQPLKIIIMSATMDVDHFRRYFNNCEVIYLSGRTYPINIFHTKEVQNDYLHACLSTLFEIHRTAPASYDILIFLTGQEEIETMASQIRAIAKSKEMEGPCLRVFPLYSQMPQTKQFDAFQILQPGTRKVVLCTNIAETSLTIRGIKYVIDSGFVKRKVYDSVTGMDLLRTVKISQDQAWQRSGRAGRESSGYCYRTYTMGCFNSMTMTTIPEIQRANITSTVLHLLSLGINCRKFDFLDKPSDCDIDMALKQLHLLGAVKSIDCEELTFIGKRMAKFPLEPRFSKMLLMAPEYGCLNEVLSIVSILSGENIFINCFDSEKRAQALTAHARFESIYGDHLTLLNVFKAFQDTEKSKIWCHENFLNYRNLTYAMDVKKQLSGICDLMELNNCFQDKTDNIDNIRKCLTFGLFNNVAELKSDNQYMTLSTKQKVKIHPSSVLLQKRARYIVFTELVSTNCNYMRTLTSIEPDWIEEICSNCDFMRPHNYYS